MHVAKYIYKQTKLNSHCSWSRNVYTVSEWYLRAGDYEEVENMIHSNPYRKLISPGVVPTDYFFHQLYAVVRDKFKIKWKIKMVFMIDNKNEKRAKNAEKRTNAGTLKWRGRNRYSND